MHRRRSTKGPRNLPRRKETGGIAIKAPKQTISEYERQLQVDEGMKKIWFKHVLSKDETLELIRFYCRRIGQCHDVSDPGAYDMLLKDMARIQFLAINMDNRK